MSDRSVFEQEVIEQLARSIVKRAERAADERIRKAADEFGGALDDFDVSDKAQDLVDRDRCVRREASKIIRGLLDG